MQPIKLTISGKYWDSQIYRGVLYLFMRDGSFHAIDWDKLVDGIKVEKSLALALECAFRRSDYLYGNVWDLFFSDPDIKQVIKSKFTALEKKEIQLSSKQLQKYVSGVQDNPFPFPHADSTIYKKKMYVVGQGGVWQGTCNKKTRYPVSSRPQRQWDAATLSVAASYNALALSAGGEGLWEFSLAGEDPWDTAVNTRKGNPSRLSDRSCDACEWMYHSIYGSSYTQGGFLAEFHRSQFDGGRYPLDEVAREFERVVPDEEVFHKNGFSWGVRDKIYLATDREVRVAKYDPFNKEQDNTRYLDKISIDQWKGDFVSGGAAAFGAILEYDNAMVVLPSEGKAITIKGEPVNWRIFPNSHFYQNHLHIVYDDCIVIYSFNNDYFVSQDDKLFGVKALFNPSAQIRRSTRSASD